MATFFSWFLAIVVGTTLVTPAMAGPLGYREGRWIYRAKFSYFQSSENFDEGGQNYTIPNNQSLSILNSSIAATFDTSDTFSLFGAVDFAYGKSVSAGFDRTRFGVPDVRMGADMLLFSGFLDLIPEVQISFPLESINESTDEIILGDGVVEAKTGAYLSKDLDSLLFYGYAGFGYRTGGRSSLFHYEFQVIKPLDTIDLNFGLVGYTSVIDDEFSATPGRRGTVVNRVNGGVLKYNSVNPGAMDVGGTVGISLSDVLYGRLAYQRTLSGKNAALGNTFWIAFSYVPEPRQSLTVKSARESQEREEIKKRQTFQPETYDRSDQEIENAVHMIKRPEPTPTPGPTPRPAPKPFSSPVRGQKSYRAQPLPVSPTPAPAPMQIRLRPAKKRMRIPR